MNIRYFAKGVFFLIIGVGLQACGAEKKPMLEANSDAIAAEQQSKAPNIVLIMTDDQGFGDLSLNHNPVINTPNIQTLANQSTSFENFHVDPTCSPTRSALLTGKHSMRAGVWHTVMGRSFLAAEHVTVAEILSDNGYDTALFGKWHLGDSYPFRPQDQGFQTSLIHGGGGVGQSGDYWGNTQFDDFYLRNGKVEKFDGYATDIWFDEAEQFIRQSSKTDKPFFAYIATNAPHSPYRAKDKDIQVYRDLGLPEEIARFYAMISVIDTGVGKIRNVLDELNITDNTIFIFMTDNGSSFTPARIGKNHNTIHDLTAEIGQQVGQEWIFNGGLRGYKSEVYEGGHKVPFYIHYPKGGIDQGRKVDTLAAHFDLLPTLMELVGIDASQAADIDGVSLVPVLKDNGSLEPRKIVVTNQRVDQPRIGRPSVVMDGNWRFVSELDKNKEELYDLASDPSQQVNLLNDEPEKAAELRQSLRDWWQDVSKDVGPRVRPIVGNANENPVRLNANDWMEAESTNVIAWYPGFKALFLKEKKEGWITQVEKFKSLPWHVEVDNSGSYQISLYFHDKPAQQPVDRKKAFLKIDDIVYETDVDKGAAGAQFTLPLQKGPLSVEGWFANDKDDAESHVPAFYAYMEIL
ncbi:MAG: arylsulfatase [Aliiglaciecola sp.]|uniref:arylsulfatase n=1 Tax=Aliiglaciecola sp. TaxID=1872441 RepID=UPI003299A0D5